MYLQAMTHAELRQLASRSGGADPTPLGRPAVAELHGSASHQSVLRKQTVILGKLDAATSAHKRMVRTAKTW